MSNYSNILIIIDYKENVFWYAVFITDYINMNERKTLKEVTCWIKIYNSYILKSHVEYEVAFNVRNLNVNYL